MTIADIVLELRAITDSDSTSFPDATVLRRVNAAYEKIIGKIISADGTWQFDDSNYTDLPIGTTTLVNAQQDYSFDSTMLEIERVEVKDVNGNYQLLNPLDKTDIGVALTEYQKQNGMPNQYDKQGSSVFLYPAPATGSVTLAAGLKIYFKRTASIYTSAEVTTGTKQPGFASPFHMYIVYEAAISFCLTYRVERVAWFEKKAMELEKACLEFYGRRERDVRHRMTMAPISHR